jgi:hypothetical protein
MVRLLVPLSEMASIIPSLTVRDSIDNNSQPLLPPFLQLNSKIAYEHDRQFHKGYLGLQNGVYQFMFKSHVNKHEVDWDVDLPNFPQTWVDLCVEGVLVPGHVAHTFLCVPSSNSTINPVAFFVSAVNFHWDCPPSLLNPLAAAHFDQEVWLQRYYKEKQGIERLATYCKITLGEYRALREKGAPKAIPTMCVLTIKRMNISSHSVLNLGLSYLEIMKTVSGPSQIGLLLSSVVILHASLLALPSRSATFFGRAIAKTPSVRGSCPQRKLRLYVLPLVILTPTPMNTSCFNECFMVFVIALAIGTTKSTKLSSLLAFTLPWRTLVSTQDVPLTPITLRLPRPLFRFLWGFMLTTSLISLKTQTLRLSSVISSVNAVKLIAWVSLNGFWVSISLGELLLILSPFISISQALQLPLLKVSFGSLGI